MGTAGNRSINGTVRTSRCNPVGGIPVAYSGGPSFHSLSEGRLYSLKISSLSSVTTDECWNSTVQWYKADFFHIYPTSQFEVVFPFNSVGPT
jgi:hypothetical protein